MSDLMEYGKRMVGVVRDRLGNRPLAKTKKNDRSVLSRTEVTEDGMESGMWEWYTKLLGILPGGRLPRMWSIYRFVPVAGEGGSPCPPDLQSGFVPVMKEGSSVRPPIVVGPGREEGEREYRDADWNPITWEEYARQMRAIDPSEFNYNQNVVRNGDGSFTEYGHFGISYPELETRSGEEAE